MEAHMKHIFLFICLFIRISTGFQSFPVPEVIDSFHHPIDRVLSSQVLETDDINSDVYEPDVDYFSAHPSLADYIFPRSAYSSFFGTDSTSLFGTAVYMSDEFAIVGGNGYNDLEGVVNVYYPVSDSSWSLLTTIASPIADLGNFGCSIDQDDTTGDIIIGADAFNLYTGQVYVYSFFSAERDSWSLNGVLVSPEGKSQGFGSTVSISGNYSIVGNTQDQAYIFERRNGSWTLLHSLVSPHSNTPLDTKQFYFENKTHFGQSVSISGNYAVVGAYQQNQTVGAAYIYSLNESTAEWSHSSTLKSITQENSYFGYSAHMRENFLIVGAIGNAPNTAQYGRIDVNNTGWAYIYELMNFTSGPMWSLTSELQSPVGENVYFGHSVRLSASNAMVGAIGYPFNQGSGAAFIYTKTSRDSSTPDFPLSSQDGDKSTYTPTVAPSVVPTIRPSKSPTVTPSMAPSEEPTIAPSEAPSVNPSIAPSEEPTISPSEVPSEEPTIEPSMYPSVNPSTAPTVSPTISQHPTVEPTISPSAAPTLSQSPTVSPSASPTASPTVSPTVSPSVTPTVTPSVSPSASPSESPSHMPSYFPTSLPSLMAVTTDAPSESPISTPGRRSLLAQWSASEFKPNDSWKHFELTDSLNDFWLDENYENELMSVSRKLLETREQQIESKAVWVLNISLPSPAGSEGAFGYAVGVSEKYFVIGADNFGAMQGAAYIGGLHAHGTFSPTSYPTPLATNATPSSMPSSQPSGQPTSQPSTDNVGNSVNSLLIKSTRKDHLGLWIAIALAIFCFLLLVCLCCLCCCVCCVPPAAGGKKKKKKKDGEDNSPYTIHGPGGELYTEEQQMSESVDDIYNRYLREEESSIGGDTQYSGGKGLKYGVKAVPAYEIVAEELDKLNLYGEEVVLAEPMPARSRLEAFQDYTDRALRKLNLLPPERASDRPMSRAERLAEYDNAAMMKIREFENKSSSSTAASPSRVFDRKAMLADYDDAAMKKIREFDRQTALTGRSPPRRTTSLGNVAGLDTDGNNNNNRDEDYVRTMEGFVAEKEFYDQQKADKEGDSNSALNNLIRNAKLRGMVAKAKFDKLKAKTGLTNLTIPDTLVGASRGFGQSSPEGSEGLGSDGYFSPNRTPMNPAQREQEMRYRELAAAKSPGGAGDSTRWGPGQGDQPFEGSLSLVEKSRLKYAEYRRKAAEHQATTGGQPSPPGTMGDKRLSEFEEYNKRELAMRHAEEERLRSIPSRPPSSTALSGAATPRSARSHGSSPRHSRPSTPKDGFSPKARAPHAGRTRLGSVSDDSDNEAGDLFFAHPHRKRANSHSSSGSGDKAKEGSSSSYTSSTESSTYRPQNVDLMSLSQHNLNNSSGVFDAMEVGEAPPITSTSTAAHRPLGALRSNNNFNNSSLFQQQMQQMTEGHNHSNATSGHSLSPHASNIISSQSAILNRILSNEDMDADLENVRRRYRNQSPAAVSQHNLLSSLSSDLPDLQIPNVSPAQSFYRSGVMQRPGAFISTNSSSNLNISSESAAVQRNTPRSNSNLNNNANNANLSIYDAQRSLNNNNSNVEATASEDAWAQFYRDNK